MRQLHQHLLAILLLTGFLASSAGASVQHLEEAEFRALAENLAPKVNLFADAWEKNPDAVFYGGTTRDYLYWIKGKFLEAKSRQEALQIRDELTKLPFIDVRDFIVGDSDVDIVSNEDLQLKPEEYGVRKIDSISSDIFNPETELGKNELMQGHVPVEKIQLRKSGLSQISALGDGTHELYTGKLTVSFPDPKKFAETKFAREGANHPILLALRYLRLQGINYFRTHGSDYPNLDLLRESLDKESAEQVNKVIRKALDGKELTPYLANQRFRAWINGTIQKSFRSYTNPTAALEILKKFKVDQLPEKYAGDIEPINNYVFRQYRDEALITANIKKYGVNPDQFYRKPADFFSDGMLYHGTRDEAAFRSIVFQGVLPSAGGSAGSGLYGVAVENKAFSQNWAGDKKRLLSFPVRPDARIVDTTSGEGARVRQLFEGDWDDFARAFGADIIHYPYSTSAFVVKNSAALGPGNGVYRPLMTKSEILARAKTWTNPEDLFNALDINQVSAAEAKFILAQSPIPEAQLIDSIERLIDKSKDPGRFVNLLSQSDLWQKHAQRLAPQMLNLRDELVFERTLRSVAEGAIALDEPVLKALRKSINRRSYRAWTLFSEVASHENWPRLPQTLNLFKEGHAGPASAFAVVARARLKPEEKALVDANFWVNAASANKKDVTLQSKYTKYIFQRPRRELQANLEEITEGRIGTYSEETTHRRFFWSIMEKWSKYPRVLDAYVSNLSPKDLKEMLLPELIDFSSWLKHEDILSKVLLKVYPELPVASLSTGWSKSAEGLSELLRVAPKKEKALFEQLVGGLLIENNLWEENKPWLLSLKLNSANYKALLRQRRLLEHPDLVSILMKKLYPEQVAQKLSRPEWVRHPALVRELLHSEPGFWEKLFLLRYQRRDAVVEILKSPAWAAHPTLLEELVGAWPMFGTEIFEDSRRSSISNLENLLNRPHWRKHRAFAQVATDKNGRFTYESFRQWLVDRNPALRTTRENLAIGCEKFFRRLFGN